MIDIAICPVCGRIVSDYEPKENDCVACYESE